MLNKVRANIQPFNLHTQNMPTVFNNSLLNKKTELITKFLHKFIEIYKFTSKCHSQTTSSSEWR